MESGKADNVIDGNINQTEAEVINRIDKLNVLKQSSYESNSENEYINGLKMKIKIQLQLKT